MKKTLIALAALAAGTAFAQSSVTMYGQLDIGYSLHQTGAGTSGANNNVAMNSGFHGPSRMGIKGSEDLGGGLKANFDLQTGDLGLDTGGTFAFKREGWVGLSSSQLGAVRLGLTSSFGTKAYADLDLNETSTSSALNNVGMSSLGWYGSSRRQNQFQYISNNYSGFSGGVAYDLSSDATATNAPFAALPSSTNKSAAQVMANYANGPLAVAFVAEGKRSETLADNRTAYALGGSYNLGVAKVSAGLSQSPYKTVNYGAAPAGGFIQGGRGGHIGVIAPIGVANVGAQFARNTTSSDNALELFANYSLSKRTRLYVDTVRVNYKDNSVRNDLTRVGTGIVHVF